MRAVLRLAIAYVQTDVHRPRGAGSDGGRKGNIRSDGGTAAAFPPEELDCS